MSKDTRKQWGGRREGAGRPVTHSKLYTIRLPEELAQVVDRQPNKTEFIKSCINRSLQETEHPDLPWGEIHPATAVSPLHIPFFNIGIVAGFPIPLDNDERAQSIELLQMLCPNPEASYLIRVQGSSMIDAGIQSGDIVIVDKSNRNPSERQVAVCEFNGEYTLKHFVIRNGQGFLVPANPDFPEIPVTPDDQFRIWGTVTYIIHKPQG